MNMKLDGVAAVFTDSLDEMDKLDREIEGIAKNIIPPNWSPDNDALQQERGIIDFVLSNIYQVRIARPK